MRVIPKTGAGKIRLGALLVVMFALGYHYSIQSIYYYLSYSPREGDIIFQSMQKNDLVDAIEGVTHSPFSHCGVVLRENNQWVVIEAMGDVHETPLFRWIVNGRGAGFAVYRLKPQYTSTITEFKKHLRGYLDMPYDYNYEMSDNAIYCSELVYKAFGKTTGEQMGKLEKLGDLDWKPYTAFIKSIQGNKLPLDRAMITPRSLSEAPQIEPYLSWGL